VSGGAFPRGATLRTLSLEVDGSWVAGDDGVFVTDVRHDSRAVEPGDLFVARRGQRSDGAAYAAQAVARGAIAVLAEAPLAVPVPTLVAPDVDRAMAWAAGGVWAHPTWSLDVVGITGTNGKTTTAWLLEHCLNALGAPCGLLGTVLSRFAGLQWDAAHTTPESDELTRRLAAMRDRGATHAVMEASSHALALGRVEAVRFRVAVFTNLTHDHLDFHKTVEAYVAAKRRLFVDLAPGNSVLNVDDPVGRAIADELADPWTYSARGADATLRVAAGGATATGIDAELDTPEGKVHLRSPLLGAHNTENLLAALGTLGALGFPLGRAAEALATAAGAPGRLESVRVAGAGYDVLVDYAHTPDALERVLATLRLTTRGRIVCVFGCGGDRDRAKRPRMAEAVARGADVAVLTSDNPRSEDPRAIIDDALPGLAAGGMRAHEGGGEVAAGSYLAVLDRREAIAAAVAMAGVGDVVLIAGKGHETYQEVRGVRASFDDRHEARRAMMARLGARRE
jgi:UDP-N-acetylmuramoyl-L-alanyl-D-glutamate--2,6-diaminopimelate ligase